MGLETILTDPLTPTVVATIVTAIISWFGAGRWETIKRKTHLARTLLDTIDDAERDDSISVPEFRAIITNAKALIKE